MIMASILDGALLLPSSLSSPPADEERVLWRRNWGVPSSESVGSGWFLLVGCWLELILVVSHLLLVFCGLEAFRRWVGCAILKGLGFRGEYDVFEVEGNATRSDQTAILPHPGRWSVLLSMPAVSHIHLRFDCSCIEFLWWFRYGGNCSTIFTIKEYAEAYCTLENGPLLVITWKPELESY